MEGAKKMKRSSLILAIILLALTLCSCASSGISDEPARFNYGYSNLYNNGEFYEHDSKLRYIDFSTLQSAYMCARPNCTHTEEETACTAYGMINHPYVIGDSLYFFDTEFIYEDGKPKANTIVYKSAIDGTGVIKSDTLEDISLEHYDSMMTKGENIFFAAAKTEFDDSGSEIKSKSFHFYSYNYIKKKLTDYGELVSGYSPEEHFYGEYNGKLYFTCSCQREEIDWSDPDTVEESFNKLNELTEVTLCEFDFKTQTVAPSDLPQCITAAEGYYVYSDGDDLVILDSNGRSKIVDNFPLYDGRIVNGYFFVRNDNRTPLTNNRAIDLATGKIYSVKSSGLGDGYEIAYYTDGNYIVKFNDPVTGNSYTKIPENELIGAKTP